MSEQKRYTAQEMREAANTLDVNAKDIIADCNAEGGSTNRTLYKEYAEDDIKFAAMLRQSANTEEENAKLKAQFELWKTNSQGAIDALSKELNSTEENKQNLKARLEAVVKECESAMKDYDCGACDFTDEPPWTFEGCEIKGCPTRLHAMEFLSILRVARGEGGAE